MLILCAGWLLALSGKGLAWTEDPAPADSTVYALVKITDIDSLATFTVLPADEVKFTAQSVAEEQRALDRAYNNLIARWKAKNTPKTDASAALKKSVRIPPFPLKRPRAKTMSVVGQFKSESEAEDKKKKEEAVEAERQATIAQQREKAEEARQRRMDQAQMATSTSTMMTRMGEDDIDEDTRKELLEELKQEIRDVVDGVAAPLPGGKAASSGNHGITVKEGKKLGDDANKPLVDNPSTLGGASKKKR